MSNDKTPSGRRGAWAALPAVAVALLPNLTCPACWPAYAGLLSALGVPMLMNNAVLLPLTIVGMAVAVGLLAFRAKRRRGFGPFAVGLLAAVMVIGGKFVFVNDGLMYGGVLLLVGASFWNAQPRRSTANVRCSACAPPTDFVQIEVGEKYPQKRS